MTKHAVSLDALASGKQVDRLMSNQGVDVWDSFARWVPSQVGAQRDLLVAMDWTDFDHDGQSTLALSLLTGHGRAAPLIWLSVGKDELADRRNDDEDACLARLAETMPPGCRVTILADLGFGYVIRFRGNIRVADADGETRPAAEWVGKGGRPSAGIPPAAPAEPWPAPPASCESPGHGARATGGRRGLRACQGHDGAMVLGGVRPRGDSGRAGQPLRRRWARRWARRWTIEPSFRDTKDLRFGMGLSSTRIGEPTRRDRLLLVSAFAMALLTLLGATGESLGMDRLLKSNTSKTRSHSLFRQGCMLYELIPNMPEHRLAPLMAAFAKAVSHASMFSSVFAQPEMRG